MPAAAVAIPGIISAGASIGQMVSGNKREKEIQRQIDNYKRQDLVNPYKSLQVSTLGADRQREDLARTMATMTDQAVQGGSRAIVGLAPNMLAQQNQQEAQIMANLDEQEKQRQQMVAQGDTMVMQMQEQREQQDLQGLGNALNTARQERMNGVNNLVQTGLSMASGFASLGAEGWKIGKSNPIQDYKTGGGFGKITTPMYGEVERVFSPVYTKPMGLSYNPMQIAPTINHSVPQIYIPK